MVESVECEGLVQEKYIIDEQLQKFVKEGGEVLACGTYLKSRNKERTKACPLSTMMDCVKMLSWLIE